MGVGAFQGRTKGPRTKVRGVWVTMRTASLTLSEMRSLQDCEKNGHGLVLVLCKWERSYFCLL